MEVYQMSWEHQGWILQIYNAQKFIPCILSLQKAYMMHNYTIVPLH